MLVKYQTPGAVGGWTLLFDEAAGDANEKFNPSFRDTVYKVPGYGSPNQTKVALANTDGQLPFKWSQNYATAAAAAAGIAALRATFKGLPKHIWVKVDGTDLYFPNCVLNSSNHDQHGREVLHIMNFDCDDVTTTPP